MGIFKKIRDSLQKTRDSMTTKVESLSRSFSKIDEDLIDELEEILIMSDVGFETSVEICKKIRQRAKCDRAYESSELKDLIRDILSEMMISEDNDLSFDEEKLHIIFVIGVNGVGKTTSIGKLASKFIREGKKVTIAAADTFRAAAIEQIEEWANRSGASLIKSHQGSDAASVVYDALSFSKSKKSDILIIDTAGRLHNKKNLMSELSKMNRIIENEAGDAHIEKFLVLDATTGQNAVNQALEFKEACDITGIILTKLDGTAKGGIVISIKQQLGIPVRYVGVGESIDDIEEFDSRQYIESIF